MAKFCDTFYNNIAKKNLQGFLRKYFRLKNSSNKEDMDKLKYYKYNNKLRLNILT